MQVGPSRGGTLSRIQNLTKEPEEDLVDLQRYYKDMGSFFSLHAFFLNNPKLRRRQPGSSLLMPAGGRALGRCC